MTTTGAARPTPVVDVLVPTCDRPAALAATLASLIGQVGVGLRVTIADQGDRRARDAPEVLAAARVLRATGSHVAFVRNLPRRGMAHQRQFLLEHAHADHVLFLDDDVLLEGDVIWRLHAAIEREGCGFVGSFVNAPSAVQSAKAIDEPPPGARIELWDGPVEPEVIGPGTPQWERRHVHFAAYPARLAARMGITRDTERLYKVAWVGGCVLFDRSKLRHVGGFSFWRQLPARHCGEDVVAQLRVMAVYGGAGLLPSGAWHQEVPTRIRDRSADAPHLVDIHAHALALACDPMA